MICLTPKPGQSFFIYRIQSKEKYLQKKGFLRKRESEELCKKWKEGFSTALASAIKKYHTISIRKHANEWKVHEKTERTAIRQNLSRNLNLLDYAIWSVLENKTNLISHPNTSLLKTAIEEKWIKASEEFILKISKSFWRRVDAIIEKSSGHFE